MLAVGLTGGLATGKSRVGRMLSGLGCFLIRMDDLGHQVLDPGGEAHEAVVARFGKHILRDSGTVDRRILAAIVFSDSDALGDLNALVHPGVRARTQRLIHAFAEEHPRGITVVEAAILIETGSYRDYDCLVVTACLPEQQIERAMLRDGLDREAVLRRLQNQMSVSEKVKYADFVIDTSGSAEDTNRQVGELYASLVARSKAKVG